MSVDIYGVEEHSGSFEVIGVSGEETFNRFWQRAIDDLKLQLIGNMVWLHKKNLPEILWEFQQVKNYMEEDRSIPEEDRRGIIRHVDDITERLESNWNKVPEAERLWMG